MEAMGNMLAGFFCASLLIVGGEGAPALLTANEHPWGRFQPNSWCIVQTTVVSNLDGQAVRTTQTSRTVLKSIEENNITLEESETLILGGRIVPKKPQTVKVDFFQEHVQEDVRVRHGAPEKITINKKVVPCAVRIYEQQTANGHLTTTIWYTPHVYPHVLRVEKILRGPHAGEDAGNGTRGGSGSGGGGVRGQIFGQSVMLVQDTAALKGIRNNRRNRTYTLRTEEKRGGITKITDARCSWDVPGGLLESTTSEFDAQNREIRRSVSRMTNYFVFEAVPVGTVQRYYRTRAGMPVEMTDLFSSE